MIYEKAGVERNAWFIERLIECAKQKGVDLQTVLTDDVKNKALPDFCIVRAISPRTNAYYQSKGVKVFNNFKTSETANDKYKTYLLAKKLNVPVMPTFLPQEETGFPIVIKSVDGHGGAEVFMATDPKSQEQAVALLKDKRYIKQKVCSNTGKDLRVYCLGKRILAGVLRTSDTDFKSNYSLGGKVELKKPPLRCRRIVKKLYKELNFDFIGIDFVFDNGKPVLNELEDPVGSRMLYKVKCIDVAEEYINYVLKKVKSDKSYNVASKVQ